MRTIKKNDRVLLKQRGLHPMHLSKNLSLVALSLWTACVIGCSDAERGTHLSSLNSASSGLSSIAGTSARDASAATTAGAGILAQDKPQSETHKRALVFSGDVRIEVKEFQDLEKELAVKVDQLGGFIGSYNESRRDQKERSGVWIVRVPVDQFTVLLDWLDTNFYVIEKSVKSRDVTEEFIDLESRLSNKRKTEMRLSEHLAKSTSKLSDILEMEKEIERVREEIERIEGRLNLLRDQSELSTLTIRAESRAAFVAVQSPTSLGTIGTIFYNSWWSIGQILYGLILLIVATLPFGIVLLAIAFLVYATTGQSPTRIIRRSMK